MIPLFLVLLLLISPVDSKKTNKKKEKRPPIFKLPDQEHYYLEIFFFAVIAILFTFMYWGKKENERIAGNVFMQVRDIMFHNFALIGNNTTIHIYKVLSF